MTPYCMLVLAGLVISQPAAGGAPLGAQSSDDSPVRLAIAVGRTYRELGDYADPANRWGFSGDVSFEQQYGEHWSMVAYATGTHFTATNERVNIILAGAGGATTHPTNSAKSSVTPSEWAPTGQANTGLQVFSSAVEFRAYPFSAKNAGSFIGGGLGVAYLRSSGQTAYRPAIALSAGHVWHATGGVRYFAEVRYTWNGFDMDYGFTAKSPRWFIAPVIGFSTSL